MQAVITSHLSKDPVLKNLVEKVPFRSLSLNSKGLYLDLLSSVISQQLSGKVAAVIENRFLNLFENRQPRPDLLLAAEPDLLRTAGLSRQKAAYLQNIARFFQEEKLEHHDWQSMENEAIIASLTRIKGIGKWTAEMVLMFTLGRPDVLPLDDLGIRLAMMDLYQLEGKGRELQQKMLDVAANWQPYRSYACLYLWRYKDGLAS